MVLGAVRCTNMTLCVGQGLCVTHKDSALRFASQELQADPEVVRSAPSQDPHALKFACAALKTDPQFLQLTGLQPLIHQDDLNIGSRGPWIVMSVKYVFGAESSLCSSFVCGLLVNHFGQSFRIFTPNGVSKSFCKRNPTTGEPDWHNASSIQYKC